MSAAASNPDASMDANAVVKESTFGGNKSDMAQYLVRKCSAQLAPTPLIGTYRSGNLCHQLAVSQTGWPVQRTHLLLQVARKLQKVQASEAQYCSGTG
eukprot:jgi/Chrzof1/6727/Cz19g06310.t1